MFVLSERKYLQHTDAKRDLLYILQILFAVYMACLVVVPLFYLWGSLILSFYPKNIVVNSGFSKINSSIVIGTIFTSIILFPFVGVLTFFLRKITRNKSKKFALSIIMIAGALFAFLPILLVAIYEIIVSHTLPGWKSYFIAGPIISFPIGIASAIVGHFFAPKR